MITLTDEQKQVFKADVLARYPKEACGFVTAAGYHACENTHPEPTQAFRIDAKDRMQVEMKYGPIVALLHSHPYDIKNSQWFAKEKYHPAWPSVCDQKEFIADNIDWGIVASDGQGVTEMKVMSHTPISLERRLFDWFISDCYSIVKDWHALNTGIVLPNFTREWNFWKQGVNVIEDALKTIPYATVHPVKEAQIGDVAVFVITGTGSGPAANIANHLGVISKHNEMFHSFANPNYYAHATEWSKWAHKAKYVVRLHQ